MREITLEQKEHIHDLIEKHGFRQDEFLVYDKDEEPSYTITWIKGFFWYSFKIYYPREYRNGFIYLSVKKGNSKNSHKVETELANLNGHFAEWLNLIHRQIKLNERTAKNSPSFSQRIQEISPKFEPIFKEALIAEKNGLHEICGMGYRKAFEFLLIDYLLYKKLLANEEEAKKVIVLKDFISLLKDEAVIHRLLTYTSWVGNEFCHYFRKHPEKEIADLKEMLQIITEWIDTKEKLIQLEEKSERINEGFNK